MGSPAGRRTKLMRHFLAGEKHWPLSRPARRRRKQAPSSRPGTGKQDISLHLTTSTPVSRSISTLMGEIEAQGELVPHENGRRPNLAADLCSELAEKLGLEFVTDGRGNLKKTFGPEDILHYAYCDFPCPELPGALRGVSQAGFPALAVHGHRKLFARLCQRGRNSLRST